MLGNEIHGTVYEGDAKTFSAVSAVGSKHAVYQGARLATGKAPASATVKKAASAPAKKTTSVPAKRVVRQKKK